jgi:hypothetical protein
MVTFGLCAARSNSRWTSLVAGWSGATPVRINPNGATERSYISISMPRWSSSYQTTYIAAGPVPTTAARIPARSALDRSTAIRWSPPDCGRLRKYAVLMSR